MKSILLLCLMLLGMLAGTARAADPGSISGKVIEEAGALPITAAVVTLYLEVNPQQPLRSTSTDENGGFKFEALKEGLYRIKVSYIGFAPIIIDHISISATKRDVNVGNIKLSSDQQQLSEVTITAEKPVVEFGADMITYHVSQSILAEGSTATDLLKNVPMVQVDIDGNTSIAGKRSTRVFIDGKPSDYMTSNLADLLNVLPSDAIEKIEVMTNPPVKYAADGEGIINIIMKKGFKVGFNGNAGITRGVQENTNANTNASYRGKNYAINGSAAYQQREARSNSNSLRKNFSPDTSFYYDQQHHNLNQTSGTNFRSGLDWDISRQQNLRLSTSFNQNKNDGASGIQLNYLDQASQLSRIRMQQNRNHGNSHNFVANADYELKADSTQKLSLGLTYNQHLNHSFRSMDRYISYPQTGTSTLQENDNEILSKGIVLNLDYDKTLQQIHTLEAGLQYQFRENDNDLLVQNFNAQTEVFEINDQLTNQFFYKEHIMSAYGAYRYKRNGWSVKSGFRTELTRVSFDLSGSRVQALAPYLSFFPNVSLNKFFSKRYTLGLSYSMRINRPRENTLNPQVNNTDPLNISYGNPALKPAYTHQMELSFGVFGNQWSFTPRLSYSYSRAVIERYRMVDNQGVSQTTFNNVGTNSAISAILIGNYRPNKKLTANANLSIIQGQYTSVINSNLNRNGLSLKGALGLSMQLPFKAAFETNFNYANQLNAQGRTRGSVNSSLAARKLFFKNRLNIRISGNDPFGKRNNILYNEGSNFTLSSQSTNNTNNFSLSMNYRFTKVRKSG